MTSKRHLSPSSNRDDGSPRRTVTPTLCQVCGDAARVINYGALSCASCKTFFRRHGFRPQNTPLCSFDGSCPITKESRRNCTACRFAKCLAVGMSSELIRKEDLHTKYRSAKKPTHELVPKTTVATPQPCLLNLLSADLSSLTPTNWRLISNVIHAFDTYSCVPHNQKIVQMISLHTEHHQPMIEHSLKIMGLIYSALQTFLGCTADFRIMTTQEQCSLIQRNMNGMLAFYCVFVFRESGIFRNNRTENALLPLYGCQNVQSTKRLCSQLDYDAALVKLMLVTIAFSSNCFTINKEDMTTNDILLLGTFRLFGSQNAYVDILWRYMLYRYGFEDTVRRFDAMIKVALNALQLSADITENNKVHQNFVNDMSDRCEYVLKEKGLDDIPLWGKDH